MRQLFVLAMLISAPVGWGAKLEGINFDKVLVCTDGHNFPIRLVDGDPTRVWVFATDRGGWFPSKITEDPEHLYWKDLSSTRYTLNRKNLTLTKRSTETQCKLMEGNTFRQIWADRHKSNQL